MNTLYLANEVHPEYPYIRGRPNRCLGPAAVFELANRHQIGAPFVTRSNSCVVAVRTPYPLTEQEFWSAQRVYHNRVHAAQLRNRRRRRSTLRYRRRPVDYAGIGGFTLTTAFIVDQLPRKGTYVVVTTRGRGGLVVDGVLYAAHDIRRHALAGVSEVQS